MEGREDSGDVSLASAGAARGRHHEETNATASAVALCNRVLAASGLVATVRTDEDVRVICSQSSVFVAACEAIRGGRPMLGVNREAKTDEDRAANNALVIRDIAHMLQTDLSHINGTRVALGDMHDICNMLEIIAALSFAKPPGGSYVVETSTESQEGEFTGEDITVDTTTQSLTEPFVVRVSRGGVAGRQRRKASAASDQRVLRQAEESIMALGEELSELETSLYGRRKTYRRQKPFTSAQPQLPSSQATPRQRRVVGSPQTAEEIVARSMIATPRHTTKFNPPKLATANRETQRMQNKLRKKRKELVGQPLSTYTRQEMNRVLEARAQLQQAAADSGPSAIEKRQQRIAQFVMERLREDARVRVLAEKQQAAAKRDQKVNPPPSRKYVKMRKQSRKVKLAYGSVVDQRMAGFDRLSTAAKWHRANKLRAAKNKKHLLCPYPDVLAHEGDGEADGVTGTIPPPPTWDPPAMEPGMTEAMKKKLHGLQAMQTRKEGTKQAKRVASLREVEESWRQAARREIWLRQHWAERRRDTQEHNEAIYLAARAHKYQQKVERLRNEKFQQDVISQKKSRKETWANRDRRILAQMFQQAVDLEKEKILNDVQVEKEKEEAKAKREGRRYDLYLDSYLDRQVNDNWKMMSQALASERQQRNIAEHGQEALARVVESEVGKSARKARKQTLARIASREEAEYWRAAHPKREGATFSRIWHSAALYKT